ncbi:hypothetical protein [Moorena sp. SIO3E8]|uniref:hypothetical protein n=1 Tax=Moorena sp. SIO3E8 TaxID=2607830 RepID=UPI0025E0AD95|nr:hypothetical protein [Moorena sp. SIO3E8]
MRVLCLRQSRNVDSVDGCLGPRINPQRLYSPLIQEALNRWENELLYLSLDTSMLWNQYCLIRVAVVYRGRAVPVAQASTGAFF